MQASERGAARRRCRKDNRRPVLRTAYATIPPKVEYELTSLGHSLTQPLATLLEWGQKHSEDIEAARKAFDC
ncbi:winged helix-turn-helix transcriptional regulator [Agrobacterium rhizogenes]|uniref:winged helix-turn-helix transcriptional regulator n=1 Tax=Rhizobium rhizogenes TaxID=359 RepID=UPI0022B70133|nr:winged helix-turn-helix transcriptional regulator [Rhizobium rhizogenes]MCZ7447231.1 winged helix-turn-helix transcriptional regulator [Rhizobium rhizogenes]